jgi:hypothetical protein
VLLHALHAARRAAPRDELRFTRTAPLRARTATRMLLERRKSRPLRPLRGTRGFDGTARGVAASFGASAARDERALMRGAARAHLLRRRISFA